MENPIYKGNLGPNNATAPSNSVNDAEGSRISRRYNRFDYSYDHYLTARYGEISPFFVYEGVEGDKVPFSSRHEIRTYTMSSPLMARVRMNKDYFMVPMQAILPINWSKIYVNPTTGDDVPDDANTYVANIYHYMHILAKKLKTEYERVITYNDDFSTIAAKKAALGLLRLTLLCELFFSDGSLLSCLGAKFSSLLRFENTQTGHRYNFDRFADLIYKKFIPNNSAFYVWSPSGVVQAQILNDNSIKKTPYSMTRHAFLQWLRTGASFRYVDDSLSEQVSDPVIDIKNIVFDIKGSQDMQTERGLNYSRCCAYQLCVAHYYTNDQVDSIFSAELWLQNMMALQRDFTSNGRNYLIPSFEYNGVATPYDALSGKIASTALQMVANQDCEDNFIYYEGSWNKYFHQSYAYLFNLFSFANSLRYGDFFTGSRPQPYALGDMSAPVVDSKVSAIDMTRNIAMQRFLNAVSRVGRRFSTYVTEVMGGSPAPDMHEPKFLTHSTSYVDGFEVENTSENQGNIVTLLRSKDGNYEFQVEVDCPCIILGLFSFDIKRSYSCASSPFVFKRDRYDMFNPYLQYTGDVKIPRYVANLGLENIDDAFGYTIRDMEYKQRFNVASGGFVDNLKSWAFICDNNEASINPLSDFTNINARVIRSNPAEFDRFYSSLSGDSLSSYFHFIIHFENDCQPSRCMEVTPTILG